MAVGTAAVRVAASSQYERTSEITQQQSPRFRKRHQASLRGGSSLREADAGIAIGFVAPPYPTLHLPGWERGKCSSDMAVHLSRCRSVGRHGAEAMGRRANAVGA